MSQKLPTFSNGH